MKNILEQINQARYICTQYRIMARGLRRYADRMKLRKATDINRCYDIRCRAELFESRADKIWYTVTGYQGPFINYKDVHVVDGITYVGLISLLDGSIAHPSFNKYAI